MEGWVAFEGRVEPLVWGDTTFTVLPLPDSVVAELGHPARVEGEVAEHPVNLAVTRGGPMATAYLWAGRSLLEAAGIAPGEAVPVRLRPAPSDQVDTPEDVAGALRALGLWSAWEGSRPGQRRAWLHRLATARRPETRAKRLAEVADALRDSAP